MKGLAFKILTPKEIAGVLSMIGVHPVVTPDAIDKPSCDSATAVFQHLSEFAYDMDVQQVKAQMPGVIQHAEIYDEALDMLTAFRLSRQLAYINKVNDFNFKDIWEPSSKRFRAVLSGIINFCRFKEAQMVVIVGMKEDLHGLDCVRLELVEKSGQFEQELSAAKEQHSAELHDMWAAEQEVQDARGAVDKLQRQRQAADHLSEGAEAKLGEAKEQVAEGKRQIVRLRDQVSQLRDQVAESPEGLEHEIQELQHGVRQQKARLEERGDERRARLQRDQALGRLAERLEGALEDLGALGPAAAAEKAARARAQAAREDLGGLRQSLEALRAEEAELEQGVQQVTADLERAKQAHEERVQQLEARRQQALVQHQELQARRTEEQKQHHALHTQRLELEAEVAAARRAHEEEMGDLRMRRKEALAAAEDYAQNIDALMAQCSGGAAGLGGGSRAPSPEAAAAALARRRLGCTPSPARAVAIDPRRLLASPAV